MATLTLNVPDALVPRIVAAIKARYPDITGTAAQVGREGIKALLVDALADYERRAAEQAGRDAMTSSVDQAYTAAKNEAANIT